MVMAGGLMIALALILVSSITLLTDNFWPKLTLTTVPNGAQVILNNRDSKAKTPVMLKVKPWVAHRVEFRLDGYHPKVLEKLEGGLMDTQLHNIVLVASTRIIHISPQAARVFLNDRKIGSGTRLELPKLDDVGRVEIKIEATGFKTWSKMFESGAVVPHALKVELEKK